jgi:hypothetical protein
MAAQRSVNADNEMRYCKAISLSTISRPSLSYPARQYTGGTMGPLTVPLNIRNFGIMVAKNAVNAALLSAVQIYHDPADNNLQNWHGIKGVLWTVGSAVAARELAILVV